LIACSTTNAAPLVSPRKRDRLWQPQQRRYGVGGAPVLWLSKKQKMR